MNEQLSAKLAAIPSEPGCYLFKDQHQSIIYVGKAKLLKNRVNQYFQRPHEGKTQKLVGEVVDVDVIVTLNEKEALLLEIDLIKTHRPKYNIMFMDDKSYPMIKITHEPFPKVLVVRDRKKDKRAKYFGPYPDARAAREVHRLIHEIFPIRKCSKMPKQVCLYYHIQQCAGPCEQFVDQAQYQQYINQIIALLKGQVSDIIKGFEQQMKQAVADLNFEQASVYRDKIAAIEYISEKQSNAFMNDHEDMVDYVVDHGLISLVHFVVKEGKLFEKSASIYPVMDDPDEEAASYIVQFYQQHKKPKQLYVSDRVDQNMLSDVLQIPVSTPQRGFKKQQMNMVQENAKTHLTLNTQQALYGQSQHDWLSLLAKLLKIDVIDTVEMYDVSHTSGSFSVGAMVVFNKLGPDKTNYRKFLLHQSNDDLGSMQEMTYRRFVRALKEQKHISDVIVVDGGYAQVKVVADVLNSLNINRPIIGLSKDKSHKTSSIVLENGEQILLLIDDPLYQNLFTIQEEVHRFVINYHRSIRQKAQTASILDEIEGIGPTRKQLLLKHFKSFRAIKSATLEQLQEVIPLNTAKNVIQFFNSEQNKESDE
jgi:excinuclease ABC subunit C